MKEELKTKRTLDELALTFEHFVNDNGNKDVHADLFRHCLTDDETFDNAFRLGMVYGYIHSALKMLIEKKELPKDRLEVAVTANDYLESNRSYQGIVDTLNKLMDSHIIY